MQNGYAKIALVKLAASQHIYTEKRNAFFIIYNVLASFV